MPSLRETQASFAAAVLGDEDPALLATIAGDGLAPAARLAIHRHHVRLSLRELLDTVYPVVRRLVDPRFFAQVADRFVARHPPAGPCLFEYGEDFPAFLGALPSCRALVYLEDVSRLEWAMHRAMHAQDAGPIDPRALGRIAPERVDRVRLGLHPALSLLESPWPIDAIWRANQPDADPGATVSLEAGGARLAVYRAGDDVCFTSLPAPHFAWRRALHAGRPLGAAAEAAYAVDPSFDLAAAFRDLFHDDLVVRYSLTIA